MNFVIYNQRDKISHFSQPLCNECISFVKKREKIKEKTLWSEHLIIWWQPMHGINIRWWVIQVGSFVTAGYCKGWSCNVLLEFLIYMALHDTRRCWWCICTVIGYCIVRCFVCRITMSCSTWWLLGWTWCIRVLIMVGRWRWTCRKWRKKICQWFSCLWKDLKYNFYCLRLVDTYPAETHKNQTPRCPEIAEFLPFLHHNYQETLTRLFLNIALCIRHTMIIRWLSCRWFSLHTSRRGSNVCYLRLWLWIILPLVPRLGT